MAPPLGAPFHAYQNMKRPALTHKNINLQDTACCCRFYSMAYIIMEFAQENENEKRRMS
jgi:hypothetical protein